MKALTADKQKNRCIMYKNIDIFFLFYNATINLFIRLLIILKTFILFQITDWVKIDKLATVGYISLAASSEEE